MYRRTILLLAIGTLLTAPGVTEEPAIPPVPTEIAPDSGPRAVVERYGPPDFAVRNVLVYRRGFAELEADITFFFVEERVREVSFSFPAGGRGAEQLRSDADRVLKRLRVLYGPPANGVRSSGVARNFVWADRRGEMLHTVVYAADREEHTLRVTRRESTDVVASSRP